MLEVQPGCGCYSPQEYVGFVMHADHYSSIDMAAFLAAMLNNNGCKRQKRKQSKRLTSALQMRGSSGVPLGGSLPGSGAGDWFPPPTRPHRPSKTIGTTAELERRPDTIQLFSPSSETAATSDPILGGELVIRVIDAQVCTFGLPASSLPCPDLVGTGKLQVISYHLSLTVFTGLSNVLWPHGQRLVFAQAWFSCLLQHLLLNTSQV